MSGAGSASASAQRSANAQGDWWGRRAGDWSAVQEPTSAPLYASALSRLGIGPGTRVLDAGCGAGLFAGMAAARGAEAIGVDASAPLVSIAGSRFPDACFEVGDVESLRFEDSAFDVVTGFNVFQYACRPSRAIAEAGRVAGPRGRVLAAIWGNPDDCEALAYVGAVSSFLPPRWNGVRRIGARRSRSFGSGVSRGDRLRRGVDSGRRRGSRDALSLRRPRNGAPRRALRGAGGSRDRARRRETRARAPSRPRSPHTGCTPAAIAWRTGSDTSSSAASSSVRSPASLRRAPG